MSPGSAVPANCGAEAAVRLSVLPEPVSVAAVRSGTDGREDERSMVTTSAEETPETLPAVSVACTVIAWMPPTSASAVKL